ncbi:hypothetical protein GCM10023187_56980 [Nibrella viscosa]|uniref:Uncharacterized protein n=1 Tax=Nibrella viscosa TaxID=1084524 RepID=A0ABP8L405_9BACT
MNKKSKDYGALKNTITGKTFREMSWEEILSLPAERLSREEAMLRIEQARQAAQQKRK